MGIGIGSFALKILAAQTSAALAALESGFAVGHPRRAHSGRRRRRMAPTGGDPADEDTEILALDEYVVPKLFLIMLGEARCARAPFPTARKSRLVSRPSLTLASRPLTQAPAEPWLERRAGFPLPRIPPLP